MKKFMLTLVLAIVMLLAFTACNVITSSDTGATVQVDSTVSDIQAPTDAEIEAAY